MKSTKPMTPRSIMNQRKAVESRGCAKVKTPGGVSDENKRPTPSSCTSTSVTPGTPTSHFMWKGHTSRRDGVTPLGVSGITNRRPVTPSTPTRPTPVKTQHTPRSERTVLFEFEDNLLITPGTGTDGNVSISRTATVHVDPSNKTPSIQFNRSRSASSLRTRKGGVKIRRSLSEARLPTDSDEQNMNPQDGELSRINVGVRVRPLQSREYGNTLTVEGNEIKVASDLGSLNTFILDNVFGPDTSQETIYNAMVKPLVDSAFQGYNACLFAYGQTGSGKTYSMMGPETRVDGIEDTTGIIPRFCHEIIERVSQVNTSKVGGDGKDSVHTSITVEVSYLEVYNEKIRDLLISPPSGNLRVREHPVYGPYVADLSRHTVNTTSDIQHFISEGNKQRVIAATEMNEKSSRSHSLFMVLLTQTTIENDEGEGWTNENTKRSQINLVDLAGSERLPHSTVTSDRLREGVNINRSLLSLGKVISALVEKRSFVPYRDSVLTWLLKESLGGNSRTGMLATISPCSSHQDETIATLRYATQARSILNTVRVNESPQNKIIRELRAEIERLRGYADGSDVSSGSKLNTSGSDHQENVYLKSENEHLKSENEHLKQEIEHFKEELAESSKHRHELEVKQKEDSNKMDKIMHEYNEVKKSFEHYMKEQDKYIETFHDKERDTENFKRRAQEVQNEKIELQTKFDLAQDEIKILKEMVEELTLEKDSLNSKLKNTEDDVNRLKMDLGIKNQTEEELRKKVESVEEKLKLFRENEKQNHLFTEQKINLEISELNNTISDYKNENEKMLNKYTEEHTLKEQLKTELDKCKIQLEIAEEEIHHVQELKDLLKEKERELEESVEKSNLMETKLDQVRKELEMFKENMKTMVSHNSSISVSVQTSVEVPLKSDDFDADFTEDPESALSSQKKEYMRLKKRIAEKKKKLEVFNAKLVKCESDQSGYEKAAHSSSALSDAYVKIKELEEELRKRNAEFDDMNSELELLRELEVRYKNKLDQSLHESEEAWNKKYNALSEKYDRANLDISELKELLEKSREQVKTLLEQLTESKTDRQVLVEESQKLIDQLSQSNLNRQRLDNEVSEHDILEQKNHELQLKIDQKNNLINELEKVINRFKEDALLNQSYATELKKKYDLLESSFKEAKKENEVFESKVEVLEEQVKMLVQELNDSKKERREYENKYEECHDKLKDCQNSLKERDEQIMSLHSQLVSSQKLLQEQMSIKIDALKSLTSKENIKKDEVEKKRLSLENKYKEELESTKEQLSRKKKRLEKMKSNIDKLEDLLVSTMRQSMERKNYALMKAEHAKVFEIMMENSYLFHWEYLLRKARTYAHKYHIPYEFEKFDENTAVVRHLLYNAKSYWFRIDFKFWFESIEKNDKWCRDYDEKLPWEVDFGSYYKLPNDKTGSLCPLDESSCKEIEAYCCQPGLICPSVWKRTIVHRHLTGVQDDIKCLLIYFKSTKKDDVLELLQVINNLANQVRDLLSSKI